MEIEVTKQLSAQHVASEISKTERELERASDMLDQYNRRIKELKKELDFLQQIRDRFFAADREKTQQPRSNRFAELSMARAAEITIRERGQPMHLKEIAAHLERGGYPHIKSPKQIYTSLMACLSRDETFLRVRPAVFGLRERDKEQKQALLPMEQQGQ